MNGWLYGWKEIAAYVGCDAKTVKKYCKESSLPVRRLPKNKPVAIPIEMDTWLKSIKKS